MKSLIPAVLFVALILGGCFQTQHTVGTSSFSQALKQCNAKYNNDSQRAKCLTQHPSYASFTNAERAIIAYAALLDQKYRSGQISKEEADFLAAQYVQQAYTLSNAAEAQQRAAFQSQMNALSANMNNLAAATALQNQAIINQQQQSLMNTMPTQTRCWRNGYYVNCQSW